MTRPKNRDMEIATDLAEVVMMLSLICLIVPFTRDMMLGMGVIAFGLILGAVLGGFFIILFRHMKREAELPEESIEPPVDAVETANSSQP